MVSRAWPDSRVAALKAASEAGTPVTELAARFGVSTHRIYQVLHQHSVDTPLQRQRHRNFTVAEYVIHRLFVAAKSRSKAIGRIFTITYEDLLPPPEYCPVLGLRLDYGSKEIRVRAASSPSIDRVDSELGYVKGNVVIMSWRANMIKNAGTYEEHVQIADFMRGYKNRHID